MYNFIINHFLKFGNNNINYYFLVVLFIKFNRLIRDYIFEDCFSSLSFEFLSVNNLSNSIDINENITYNESKGDKDLFNTLKLSDDSSINPGKEKEQLIQNQNKIEGINESSNVNVNNTNIIYDSYDDIKKLISEYSFFEVVKIIIQLNNNMNIEGEKDKMILEKLKPIMEKFNEKEDMLLLLLSALNDKFANKETKENKDNIVICLDEDKSNDSNNTNYNEFKYKYEYIIVLKKCSRYIHSYKINNIDKNANINISCENKNCKAFCNLTNNKITSKGRHNHQGTLKLSSIQSLYPEIVKNKMWKYARIIKYNGKEYIKIYE